MNFFMNNRPRYLCGVEVDDENDHRSVAALLEVSAVQHFIQQTTLPGHDRNIDQHGREEANNLLFAIVRTAQGVMMSASTEDISAVAVS